MKQKVKWIEYFHISEIIKNIEKEFPGWWYSLSQELLNENEINLIISLGPCASSSPDANSLYLATTDEGDKGYIFLTTKSISNTSLNTDHIRTFFNNVKSIKECVIPDKNNIKILQRTQIHRKYTSQSLDDLGKIYYEFCKLYLDFDPSDTIIKNIYIGSCFLSVDSSIRGLDYNGKEFDITTDLRGNATLADSLESSIDIFKFHQKHGFG